jgi:hypothetical protein
VRYGIGREKDWPSYSREAVWLGCANGWIEILLFLLGNVGRESSLDGLACLTDEEH